ncbi:hypothetical protein E2C01_073769 [Portunus trituberculatus]|uniref:Uncharacterized protein n=1 Tax=Portunus trituberculatus TaxID=210409 RepID=A0A5B7IAC4_PORTR|nr:hypothetical protein [Portunus trituberculatus]
MFTWLLVKFYFEAQQKICSAGIPHVYCSRKQIQNVRLGQLASVIIDKKSREECVKIQRAVSVSFSHIHRAIHP